MAANDFFCRWGAGSSTSFSFFSDVERPSRLKMEGLLPVFCDLMVKMVKNG